MRKIMIKKMPILLTFFLFLLSAVAALAENTPPLRSPETTVKTPAIHLSESNVNEQEPKRPSDVVMEEQSEKQAANKISGPLIMRLSWKLIPGAVKYKVSFDDQEFITYINAIEIQVNDVSKIFKVTAMALDGSVIKDDLDIIEIETNPTAPKTTTEFDKMEFSPLYPVYSWVPVYNADYYLIELLKDGNVVRSYQTNYKGKDDIYDFYDTVPMNEGGNYYWRVRAMSKSGVPMSEWSKETEATTLKVTAPTRIAALGDSITHGGGAVSVPPSMIVYNWETYCSYPIKNLGRSGDTSDEIVDRFESDVLPFLPNILIIMAGVNDYRDGIFGWHTVTNYKLLNEKCKANNIIPVFVTPTPINPHLIKMTKFIEQPPSDWQAHYRFVCAWIRTQENYIDVSGEFEDSEGNLRADLTTDGLHPDDEGKKIIGHAVNEWLKAHNQ